MRAFYTDHFGLPLPVTHRFPMAKYGRLRERLSSMDDLGHVELLVPAAASKEQLLRVHNADYVDAVFTGDLDRTSVRRIGFPWSPGLVERSRRSVGATIEACRAALEDGVSVNMAGGTHHAGTRHGEGYCVFNDSAVAARAMQAELRAQQIIVIDCDVHQGNGTAEIFGSDPTVYTFDIYGDRNFPFTKAEPDCGIALGDGTGDDTYLDVLARHLTQTLEAGNHDLAIYVSGADPFSDDKLGRLALTKRGLAKRDQFVLESCRDRGIPVAVTMAGGYAEDTDDIVDIHLMTIRQAVRAAQRETVG